MAEGKTFRESQLEELKKQRGEFDPDDIRNLGQAIEILDNLKKQTSKGSDEAWIKIKHARDNLDKIIGKRIGDPEKETK